MARPLKSGLDYFPLDVNIFDDEKVAAISGEFQIKGEITLIKLLCAIYRNGYFYEWSEMNKAYLLRSLPTVTPGLLEQIVERLVRWGFFDKSLFDSHNILTSRSIQERYFAAIARRKVSHTDYPYLLVNVGSNTVNAHINAVQQTLMFTESTQSKVNKIKTPLNLPTGGSINQGFSSVKSENKASPLENEIEIPDVAPAFNDGVRRNYGGLLESLRLFKASNVEMSQIILLSNYGEIGHPVWKYIAEVRNNSKIQMPARFILSRLRNVNIVE